MDNTPERVSIEVSEITYEIRKVFGAAAEQAEVLESLSSCANDAVTDVFGDSPADLLRQRAHRLRGAALHSANVAMELAAQAGRLEALAFVKQAIDVAREDLSGESRTAVTSSPSKPPARKRRTRRQR